MKSTPIQVLYEAEATEDVTLKRKTAKWELHECSLCGNLTEVAPAGSILGKNFGSWGDLTRHNVVTQLCKPCAWSFKNKSLLRTTYLILPTGVQELTWHQLGQWLLNHTITKDESVIAPVGGRKIVAPYSQWGYLASDYGNIKWTPQYRQALKACYELNKVGLRGSMLSYEQIPYSVLEHTPLNKHKTIQDMWQFLQFIREDKTLNGLFVKLSMNFGKGENG